MELSLFVLAFIAYTAATALALGYAATRREELTAWMWRVLGLALAFHLASSGVRLQEFWRIPQNRYLLPINSFYGALSYLALATAAVFWVVEGRHRLHILGAFVLPLAWISAAAALWRAEVVGGTEISSLTAGLQSYWINIHPVVLMTAYAAFANAFGVALALLVQERQVKSRRPSELCYRLPPIEEMDSLNYRIIATFFPVLTVGIFMGGMWAYNAWGRFWGWDAKETWSLVTWFIYVLYLHMRMVSGMRGKKPTYVSMAGFASVAFTFAGVNYLSHLHGYLSGGGGIR